MPDETKSVSTREPRPLSVEYHKARKQLMLWAAILFIWELVGIDLDKAKEVSGNFGSIISAIKSPQAVPWALLIMVGYFVFKLTIEWRQCGEARRQIREAKLDYRSACIVAGVACLLYTGQAISRVQLADRLQDPANWFSFLAGLVPGMGFAFTILATWVILRAGARALDKQGISYVSTGPVLLLIVVSGTKLAGYSIRWAFELIGMGVGCLCTSAFLESETLGAAFSRLIGRNSKSLNAPKESAQEVTPLPKK